MSYTPHGLMSASAPPRTTVCDSKLLAGITHAADAGTAAALHS